MVLYLHNQPDYLILQLIPPYLKRVWKITRTVLLVLIGLLVMGWLAIQTSPVQNWLVRQVTGTLSKNLKTTVSIDHVDFSLFNNMHLEGTLVKDRKQDTLLYAGEVTVNITDWFFFKDNIVLKKVQLNDALIKLNRTDSVWNYAFLIDYFGGGKKSGAAKPLQLSLNQLTFNRVRLIQEDRWRGEDQELWVNGLAVQSENFDLPAKKIRIRSIALDNPLFTIKNYAGLRPRLPGSPPSQPVKNNPQKLRWNPEGWDIRIDELSLDDGIFRTNSNSPMPGAGIFDGEHIEFSAITGTIKDIHWIKDSILARVSLRTKERSGLEVTRLEANARFHPEAMEFTRLDLRTNRSRLQHAFAMRYNSFNDLGNFISQVTLDADLDNAELSSDDIAYFAPALKALRKKIKINGQIKGPVDDLQAKSLVIEAGNSTYLNGNIRITGLPEIEKTYIDFDANNFRTTYYDAVAIIPALKSISTPRLDLLQYLRFKGNFTGFLDDFVTYGTLETNLGTVVSDVNMKFPAKGKPRYSGTINTSNFQLGSFIQMPEIGLFSFKGKVNGDGLEGDDLNAKLDGFVDKIEVNDYAYRQIEVIGTVAKKRFNGQLIANDSNLNATLNGLVDFSGKIPTFDFNASIAKADLHKINITRDSIEFSGKFRFDFSGNHIDNFLGTARIYDANLLRNGSRLAFDSLSLESKILDQNKVITVLSNEFDAALVGEFSIRELPDAFQAFLNKYYPSYINPSKALLQNENFSFVITTKNVQEYMSLFVKDLGGFNYSTITGRINTRENLLDLNAEVPQFSYKNLTWYNVSLKGAGNYNKLTIASSVGDLYLNDSLHFPGTVMNITSANDTSAVSIITSANQTLNAAQIAATVNTRKNGISILFDESNFDINGKTWTIDKKGELVLSKDLVSADGVRISTGQQEIRITTMPSDIGNTNDIKVDLQRINLGDFMPYLVPSNRMEGLLSGTVSVVDPFGRLQVDLSATAEQFRLDDDSLGLIKLGGNYNHRTGIVNFNALSENLAYQFDLNGSYNIPDSTSDKQLDITANLHDTRINLLERYLSSVFSEVDGKASGTLHIYGNPKNLKYVGDANLKEGKLTVAYTNVSYKIPQASFAFRDGLIDFGSFILQDSLGNSGMVTRGKLKHQAFDEMSFDFALTTNKLLVLNTNSLRKDPFYGNVIARTNLTFTGPMEDMVMNVKAEPADSSQLFIRSGSSRESGEADFLVWKTYGREMEAVRVDKGSKLTFLLDATVNNLVEMNVIIDELANDIMTTIGHGNLKMQANTAGLFNMTGQFDIDEGNYNFKFQSMIRKPFKLKGEGSYIRWSGDATDADLNVVAVYEADNVKFSDLGDQLYSQGGDIEYIKKYRGRVNVQAKITGKLMRPEIDFALEMPDQQMRNDPIVLNLLRDIQADKNELTKQVAFLILFNSFGPRSTSSQNALGGIALEGIVSSSISGYISSALNRQFSNIVQKIFKDESIKVNFNAQLYNGANLLDNTASSGFNIDRTNLNFSLAKSVFNERLTFTFGSAFDFGLTAAQARVANSLQFLPDITAELKLRPDGKLLLTFFYRDSYNYQSASGKQNRSGAGISYRRDFERISDLWRNDRKKKKFIPATAPGDSSGKAQPLPDGSQ